MKKITAEDLKDKKLDEIIMVLFHKIDELVDAFNEHTKPVEMPPHHFGSLEMPPSLDNLPISATRYDGGTHQQPPTDGLYVGNCQHESNGMVYTSNPPQYKCTKCGQFYR